MALVEDIPLKITKDTGGLDGGGQRQEFFRCHPTAPPTLSLKPHISVRYRMGQWQPPKDFKDWNDCLLGKRSSIKILLPNMTVTITSPSNAPPA